MPIEVVGLTGSGGDAVTYYVPWRIQQYVKPATMNVTMNNVSIEDPVVVDLLTGQVYEAEAFSKGKRLTVKGVPLTDYPMAIVSRAQVKLK